VLEDFDFRNITFGVTISPFHWWRFQMKKGIDGFWLIVGPFDLDVCWLHTGLGQ
jgi:hypothetical protein